MGEDRPPTDWDFERIRRTLEHYESQSDEDAVQEDEDALVRAAPLGDYTEERCTLLEDLPLEEVLDSFKTFPAQPGSGEPEE